MTVRLAPVLPGATVGVLGGGQLGRMFAWAARRMGYRVAVWSDADDAPALAAADLPLAAAYDDPVALDVFTDAVAVATVEFENLPAATLAAVAARVPLRPSATVVATTQGRAREKAALAEFGVPVAPWRAVGPCDGHDAAVEALAAACAEVGRPAVLKTAGFGYDGKGQVALPRQGPWPEAALALVEREACVVEAFVDLAGELSVIVARSPTGEVRSYPPFENHHANHVLDLTLVPARVAPATAARAEALGRRVVEGLEVVGLACVELFLTRAGALWVNEVAPRPHNSGHITIEACRVDQFEQQLRAVCGLPLGDPQLVRAGAMANLMGDLWADGTPDWAAALAVPGARLHLYGKRSARAGRKMGHLSAVAGDADEAGALVWRARAAAGRGGEHPIGPPAPPTLAPREEVTRGTHAEPALPDA